MPPVPRMPPVPAVADQPQRIVLIRPSALGDVARTVPALVSLRRAFPGAKIDWLVRDTFSDVVAHHPDLNEVVTFPRDQFRRFGTSIAITTQVLRYMKMLKRRQYDAAYDLQGLSRSGLLTRATRAPRRVGLAAPEARELAWLAYNHRIKVPDAAVHAVDRMLAVLEGDGVPPVRDMRLYVGDPDRAWAERYMDQHQLTDERFAVIAPTARWLSKRWPIERFGAVADRLPRVGFDAAVVVASKSERPQVTQLSEGTHPGAAHLPGVRRLDLVGGTTVGQLMAIIERCGLLIANDSAALHIAVGLGRRCVGIYGPTDPAIVGPYRYELGIVAAPPEMRRNYRDAGDQSIIAAVTVEQVWTAIERVLAAAPPVLMHGDGGHV